MATGPHRYHRGSTSTTERAPYGPAEPVLKSIPRSAAANDGSRVPQCVRSGQPLSRLPPIVMPDAGFGIIPRPRVDWRRAVLLAAVLVFMAGFVTLAPARAAVRTWTGAVNSNWNLAANWIGGVPGAGDVATFDATGTTNATINTTITVGGVDITAGYTGTITQAAGSIVNVGASGFSQAGGTFVGGSSAMTVTGPFGLSGGSFTATATTLSISGTFTYSSPGSFNAGVAGTVALTGGAATIDVPTSVTFRNLTHAAGAKTIAAGDTVIVTGTLALNGGSFVGPTAAVEARGNVTQASAYAGGTATLRIAGPAAQTFTGSALVGTGSLPPVVIDAPADLTLAGLIRTTNGWTYLGGTVQPGTSTVVFAGNLAISGDQRLNNVEFNGNGTTYTLTGGTVLTVSGSLTLTNGFIAAGTLEAHGNISQGSSFDGGPTGTLRIAGPAAQTFTGSALVGTGSLPPVVIDAPADLTLAGLIRTTNGWTYLGGTVQPGTSTVVFAGNLAISGDQRLNNVELRGAVTVPLGTTLTLSGTYAMPSAVVVTLAGSIIVAGQTSLTDGTLNGTGSLVAHGSITQAQTFDGGTATLRIAGPAAQTFTGSALVGTGSLPPVVIDAPADLTLAGLIRTTNGWTYLGGTVQPGTSTVVFAGNLAISGDQRLNNVELRGAVTVPLGTTLTLSGTYAMPSAVVVTLAGSIIVAGQTSLTDGTLNGTGSLVAHGSITQAQTFDGGTATLRIAGPAAQTFTGSALVGTGSLPPVVIDAPADLTLAGLIRTTNGWTYLGGTVQPGTSTVVFAGNLAISGNQRLNNVEFNGNGTTYTLTGGTVLTVSGSLTLTNGFIAAGTLEAHGNISQGSSFDGGPTGTLRIAGPAAQTFTGSALVGTGSLPPVVIDAPADLTLAGLIRTTNGWTYLGGTVQPGTSTVVFAGNLAISGDQRLNNVEFNGNGTTYTLTGGTVLTVSGSLMLTNGFIAAGTLEAHGNISQGSSFDGGPTGTLRIAGPAAQTFTGSALVGTGSLPPVVIDAPADLTLAGLIRTTNGWTYLGGTVQPGTSTVVFAGNLAISGNQRLNNVEFNGNGTTYTLTGGTVLTVSGSLMLTNGFIAAGTLEAHGNISQGSSFDGGPTGTLRIAGPAAQTFTGSALVGTGSLPPVVIDAPADLTLAGLIRTTNGWTYLGGTVQPGTSTVVFAGNLAIDSVGMAFFDLRVNGATTTLASALVVDHDLFVSGGTLNTATGSHAISVANDLTVSGTMTANASLISVGGNLAKTGTFNPGTSMLMLDGTTGQTISGTAWTIWNLIINDTVGVTMATDVSATGALTLTSGNLVVAGNTLSIANPIAGTATNLSAGSTSSVSIVGIASGISIPSSVTELANFTVDNPAGVSLEGNLTVNGTQTLANGPILTGPSILEIAPGGQPHADSSTSRQFRKTASVGSPIALTYEVGDATTTRQSRWLWQRHGGRLTASARGLESSPIVVGMTGPGVNGFWTVTNGGDGLKPDGDTLIRRRRRRCRGDLPRLPCRQGRLWHVDVARNGTRSALTTEATGLASFSDFVALGEAFADLALTKTDGVTTVTSGDGLTYAYLLTVTNAGPSDATSVVLTDSLAGRLQPGPSDGLAGELHADRRRA